MAAYYNEWDSGAAEWLRELIKAGHIADGVVDERSICDVDTDDLRDFTQCHFFAGIGGWSYALRLSGIPDELKFWTGSPPCQPFSSAGKQKGKEDERHLAPTWLRLVSECRPPIIFGEQVESAVRHGWLDDLQDELEAQGYAVGSAAIPAACVGAPHIRQRLFFGAVRLVDSCGPGLERQPWNVACCDESGRLKTNQGGSVGQTGTVGLLADADRIGRERGRELDARRLAGSPRESSGSRKAGLFAVSSQNSLVSCELAERVRTGAADNFWDSADWLFCRDGKWRPVESGTFPLADGISGRMGLLRGYGNAIVPQAAAALIQEFCGAVEEIAFE